MTELWRYPATAIAALVRAREVSAREATESALARLDAANGALNAVVDIRREDALAAADALDARLSRGEDPGPLAGVPVTVKTISDMAGCATTNGLRLQKDHRAEIDNPVPANLRRAGAVIIGRTNTPAFSIRWFTRNSLNGATFNPHDKGLTPGGSSGGAASAVAAGIGAVAHGTDIAGSIRYPAYACNVHGLRPTVGRVSAVNFSMPSRTMGAQVTAVSGPLARRLCDLRVAHEVLSVGDHRDPWFMPAPHAGPPVAKRAALSTAPDGLATDPAVVTALRAAADRLAGEGWEITEIDPPSLRHAAQVNMALWQVEFHATVLNRLEAEGDPDATFVAHQLMRVSADYTDPLKALKERADLVRAWQIFLEEYPLLISPVSAELPFPDHLDLESEAAFERVYEAQLTQVALPAIGVPALTVATGRPGAPMGVQLVAQRFREDVLFEAGAIIEAAHPPVAPVDPFAAGTETQGS